MKIGNLDLFEQNNTIFNANTGTATATNNLLYVTGILGVSTSATGSTITFSGSGGGLGWYDITSTGTVMVANAGYVSDNASLVVLTLPSTPSLGDTVVAAGGKGGTGGWKIAQPTGTVQIHFGNENTTLGTAGYVASTQQYDSVTLVCVNNVTTSDWIVRASQGNITVN